MSDLLRDIRLAVRSLSRTPAFTALSVITVALGIGASTAVFSMVNGALLKKLPYAADRRLVRVWQANANNPEGRLSVPELDDYRKLPAFAGISEYHSMPFQFYGRGDPQRVQTGVVSDNFFDLLGVKPILGRGFVRGEEKVGAPNVILLSHRYWLEQFGGDRSVVGSKFTMNDRVGTIIGVLPPLPVYPDNNDIWMPAGQCPFRSAPQVMGSRTGRMLQGFAVTRPGVTLEIAQRQLDATSHNLRQAYPESYPAASRHSIASVPVRDELTRSARPLLLALLASALFVLVIAGANFANLTLSRQLRRKRELALRAALGADRARIFKQLVTESVCVTSLGAVLGVGLAYGGLGLLRTFAARVSPRAAEITIDPVVLGFAMITSLVVGLIAATMPLWKSTTRLSDELRAGAVTTTGSRHDGRTRNLLVALQVAIAFVVLAGAGLMVRSLVRLQSADGGYVAKNVLTARVDLNWSRYTSAAHVRDFADQLMQRMSTEAGATAVAVSSDFPLNNGVAGLQPFLIRSRPVEAGREPPTTDVTSVSPDYFKVIGVPLLRGRVFTNADRDTAYIPAIVSRRLAATHWAGKDPIGDQVSINQGRRWLTIVGVVGDVRQNGPAQNITDEIYIPFLIAPTSDMRVLVHTTGNSGAAATALRGAVRALDDRQPIVSVQTLEDLRGARLSEPRVATILLAAFAVISLVITTGGLGGVVAYSVSQRTTEIGIRMALGAERGNILWSVTRDGALVIAAGLAIGVATALAATRVMSALLYETTTTDVWTYVGVTVLLSLIGVVSCLVPARRALLVDPIRALRAR
ncbi:MAG: ABC transporter permease [Gemmatimonadaceae bacterium]